jgi:hypothetical protein
VYASAREEGALELVLLIIGSCALNTVGNLKEVKEEKIVMKLCSATYNFVVHTFD